MPRSPEIIDVELQEETLVDIRELEPDPDNIRLTYDQDVVQGLAEAVTERSRFHTPPRVYRSGGKLRALNGSTRVLAAQLARRKSDVSHIPVIVGPPPESRREKIFLQLEENDVRAELGPVDRGRAFRILNKDEGLSYSEILEQCRQRGILRGSRTKAWVSQLVALTELEPSVQAMVNDGRLSVQHGLALRSVPGEQQRELGDRAVAEGLGIHQFQDLIARQFGSLLMTDPSESAASLEAFNVEMSEMLSRAAEQDSGRMPVRRSADPDRRDGPVSKSWMVAPVVLGQGPRQNKRLQDLESREWMRSAAPELRDLAREAVLGGHAPAAAIELAARVAEEASSASAQMRELIITLGRTLQQIADLERDSAPAEIARIRLRAALRHLDSR